MLLIYLIAIVTTILVVDSGIVHPFRHWLKIQIPNLDKLGHFLGMGILTFLVFNAIGKAKLYSMNTFGVLFIITTIVIIEEFSQRFIASRSFQYWDLVADYSGIIAFTIAFFLIQTHSKNKNSSNKSLLISNN